MTLKEELQGTYVLLEEIGSGGGGTVFKAYHRRLQKEVVLKKIHANLTGGNIRAEADILKNLKSEYLPQVLDFFELDGDVYTVMDFIPGSSLKLCLEQGEKFSPNQVLKWLDQLCAAVEKLHEQTPPIIHGDIKPANIMLTPDNNICLIDFNVSGDFENADVAGFTPGYASPEQVSSFQANRAKKQAERAGWTERQPATRPCGQSKGYAAGSGDDATEALPDPEATELVGTAGAAMALPDPEATELAAEEPGGTTAPHVSVDARSDIYSIGATVYHLLTGERPGTASIKPILEYPIKLEESFAYLIMKCLEREPDNRYQSVTELHRAVLNVHKSGKRYRALLRKQLLCRMTLVFGIVGFAWMAVAGRAAMQEEKLEKYHSIIALEKEAREQGKYGEVSERFAEAAGLFPEKGEAYMELLCSLYQQKMYAEAMAFMEDEILRHVTEGDVMSEIYSLYGNSCLEAEEYSAAADAFAKAIYYDNTNAGYFQECSIALARMGQTEEAMHKLEQAIKYGLGNDAVYYTQGEIALALDDLNAAWDCFYKCIGETKDDYRKMRAYLMCSRILGQQGRTDETGAADIALLEEAVCNVGAEYSNALLERLAQAYIDMGERTGEGGYDMQAIAVLEKIAGYGWASYTTYQNMAILYQKNGMYEEGLTLLGSMLEQFGENYNTYKRMAFMEVSRQTRIEAASRDYGRFAEYYGKAMELYGEQLSGNQTDVEMMTLQNLYEQAVQGGWIK